MHAASSSSENRPKRIAIVQHGDYLEATQIIDSGQPEPYTGMGYSVETLRKLTHDRVGLIVSLNPESTYDKTIGETPCTLRMMSSDAPRLLPKPFPAPPMSIRLWLQAKHIAKTIRAFQPDALLMRSGAFLATHILSDLHDLRLNTLFVGANYFNTEQSPRDTARTQKLVSLLNEDYVYKCGNHQWPATQSMVDAGVNESKCVPWDFPRERDPDQFEAKSLRSECGPGTDKPFDLFFAGAIITLKGVFDLVEAAKLLQAANFPVRMRIAGDGADIEALKQAAAELPATHPTNPIEILGRIGNEDVTNAMRESDVVCVPSHHAFPEGMPFVITEALTARTPVIASDHPVITKGLKDGLGITYFQAQNPKALAEAIQNLLTNADHYRQLSEQTLPGYRSIVAETKFHQLLEDWVMNTSLSN